MLKRPGQHACAAELYMNTSVCLIFLLNLLLTNSLRNLTPYLMCVSAVKAQCHVLGGLARGDWLGGLARVPASADRYPGLTVDALGLWCQL